MHDDIIKKKIFHLYGSGIYIYIYIYICYVNIEKMK